MQQYSSRECRVLNIKALRQCMRITLCASLALLVSCSDANSHKPSPNPDIEPFYVNATESHLSQYITISLITEGYPIANNAYRWSASSMFADDGTREKWQGNITLSDSHNNIVTGFHVTCETTSIDKGFIVVGGLCDLSKIAAFQ